ncbi:MAG: CehA/McbA family metallohydrolase [Fibrobacteria bacterium]|nr:CehA/McbA family metallohydrolase [Fibrobacteria bacterium]
MRIYYLVLLVALSVFAAPDWEWYTADSHLHVNGCKNQNVSAEQILKEMKEENINIASLLVWGGTNGSLRSQDLDVPKFRGQEDDPISEANRKIRWDVELSQLAGEWHGHLVFLNVKKGIFGSEPYDVNYPGQDFLLPNHDYLRDMGGLSGYQHFMFWFNGYDTPVVALPVSREMPMDITMTRIDFMASEFMDTGRSLWFWYEMLQAGYHLPFLGDSDYGCIHNKVGAYHAAFPLAAGDTLTYSKFIEMIRKGRIVAKKNTKPTDHLDIRIDSVLLGDTLFLSEEGDTVQVEVDASSAFSGRKVQLVMNGQVIEDVPITSSKRTYSWEVVVEKSSWIAARIPFAADSIEAHTNSILLLVNGCPVRNDPQSARNWKNYLDKYYQYAVQQNQTGSSSTQLKEYIDIAKAVWEDIALEGEGQKEMTCVEPVSIKRKNSTYTKSGQITEFAVMHEGIWKLGPDGTEIIQVSIYSIQGELLATVKGNQWNGLDSKGIAVPDGVYFARLQFPEKNGVVRFSLVW